MTTLVWPRAIVFVDMNAFFAAVEQLDNPVLRGQPVAVTNGQQGTCIITCSYEARRYGIKTGMRLKAARQYCPRLIQCASRPQRYARISTMIMNALQTITPDVEVFSIDEAFLDVTHCQRLSGDPIRIARLVKQTVYQVVGLSCSVGVSGDKTTAKFAANCEKPDGFTVILPWEAQQRLQDVPVTRLCGIAEGTAGFLAQFGAYTCGDVAKLPIGILAKRFGNIGRRIWAMCQGADPSVVQCTVNAPKSMGHGKVMPPRTVDRTTILIYLQHMSEKLAARLRQHAMQAQTFSIGLRCHDSGWLGGKYRLILPGCDGRKIYGLCKQMLRECWTGQAVWQVQVTALDPVAGTVQLDLFRRVDVNRTRLNQAVDGINQRYGEFTLMPARLLQRSSMPNVIAPAWKPVGHRQTITDC